MFSPQKKLWPLTPRCDPSQKNGSVSGPAPGLNTNPLIPRNGEALTKGKAVGFLLDNQESSTHMISNLQNKLFKYQYKMGLLLIEKEEWSFKYDELRQALADATDSLKREQTAHYSAMLEMEKREESLKKLLGVERQCVFDLEKALREMRSEYAEIKFSADSKLAEANALVTSVEEKSLEVEAKLHAANAKFAEVSRKSSEIERKLHELEAQENVFRRERFLFTTEREAHDTSISKQREHLREWERKLQEAEERLVDGRRLLNQREERANELDNLLKEKKNDIAELRMKIEIANSTLRTKEDDISSRVANVTLKEQEAEDVRKKLEDKEKHLMELEDKLNAREKLEMQKLLDEHNNILAEKQKDLELEMEQKRHLNDELLKNKVVDVENKEAEIKHMEEKVKKREQAVENKMKKVREREVGLDSKSKALVEREKSLKVEEKNLENDRKQLIAEKEELLSINAALENVKTGTEKLQLRLSEKKEQLKVTEEERKEHTRLQSELKQEIDKYRFQSAHLMKEANDLKQDKGRFEAEWEELDHKKEKMKQEQEYVLEQKRCFEKLRQSEKERLHNEKLETEQHVQREVEALKLAKESFSASIEHEKSMLAEKLENEKSELEHGFELLKQEFEAKIRMKQDEKETSLNERENSFEQEKEMELSNINYLREVAKREMDEMKVERQRIEKDKLEISQNKQHVEAQQSGMKKDIEELVRLSQKLKGQREQFIKERECFIVFAEKQKNCNICGESVREFVLSDLHLLAEMKNLEAPSMATVTDVYLKEAVEGIPRGVNAEPSHIRVNSGYPLASGTISWLRKCTSKILKFSPGKKLELDSAQGREGSQIRPGKRSRSRSGRTRSGKDSLTNGDMENSVHSIDDIQAESDQVETAKNKRKRNHTEGSQATDSDSQNEGHSENIKDGCRPKTRQRVVDHVADQNLGPKQNNLRQPKRSVGTIVLPQARRGKEKGADQQPALKAINSEDVEISGAPAEEVNKTDGAVPAAAIDFSADSPCNDDGGTKGGHTAFVDNIAFSEEVNGIVRESEYRGEELEEDDNGGDDDEVNHPGEVSMGKKLWTFLTT